MILSIIQDVWDSIRSQYNRSILAFTAIAIGVVSLTSLICILEGLRHKSDAMINEMGADVVALKVRSSSENTFALKKSHLQILRENLSGARVSQIKLHYVYIPEINRICEVVATDQELSKIRKWKILKGRFFDNPDISRQQQHCIISEKFSVRHQLKPGDPLTLKTIKFRIVGIIEKDQHAVNDVYIPSSLLPYWQTENTAIDIEIDTIFIQAPLDVSPEILLERARNILAINKASREQLQWTTPAMLVKGIRKTQKVLQLGLGSIAFLCLTLGACTLMSLMIANVRERVPEIGLRLALGASQKDIYILFLSEALFITGSAVLVGVSMSHLTLVFITHHLNLPFSSTIHTWITPALVTIFFSLLFSYFPARQAALIQPADALRYE